MEKNKMNEKTNNKYLIEVKNFEEYTIYIG